MTKVAGHSATVVAVLLTSLTCGAAPAAAGGHLDHCAGAI